MSATYTTRDGDTIDSICWAYYGATSGIVEQVVEVNRFIEDQPEVLEAGIKITLPDLTLPTKGKATVRLWD